MADHTGLQERIDAHPYWFHRIDLGAGVVTPGWDDPGRWKLQQFGVPADMTGRRVLDIGCAEGFFSFEAERRGASEVVAMDEDQGDNGTLERFRLCADALGSKVMIRRASVSDLDPETFGTFDIVLFFGVLYHLTDMVTAVESIASVTRGRLLLQSHAFESSSVGDVPVARFHAHGITSGTKANPLPDRTVRWVPNAACVRDLLIHAGFDDVVQIRSSARRSRRQAVSDALHPRRERRVSAVFHATHR